jgi:hypothetical protein
MLMNIVHYIKTISASLREKSFHFRHAIPLFKNTLCYTCMPSRGRLHASLSVLNGLMPVKSCYIPTKKYPTDRRYNGTA